MKTKIGTCNLCLKERELNYEHVPPRSCFNRNTKFTVGNLVSTLKSNNNFDDKPKGKVNQGGIGFHSFCIECNSKLGSSYVREYKEWVNIWTDVLRSNFKGTMHIELTKNLYLSKIGKHIISMFLAINDQTFANNNKELLEYVNNPNFFQFTFKI